MHIRCDGEELEGDFAFGMITNSKSVGGFLLPLENYCQGDGLFELTLLKRIRRFSQIPDIISTITGTSKPSDRFVIRSATEIVVTCADEGAEMRWTLDGEFGGLHSRAAICVKRQALSILCPAG
jgi:diacylglycerol kinase family enzyme